MDESTLWTTGTVAGLTVLGAAAGAVMVARPPSFATPIGADAFLATTLFFIAFLACGFSMQLYRRGLDHSTLVGAVSGALCALAFFGTPVAVNVWRGSDVDAAGALIVLTLVPLFAAALSGGGTLFLANGVKRYREKNGLIHAPR